MRVCACARVCAPACVRVRPSGLLPCPRVRQMPQVLTGPGHRCLCGTVTVTAAQWPQLGWRRFGHMLPRGKWGEPFLSRRQILVSTSDCRSYHENRKPDFCWSRPPLRVCTAVVCVPSPRAQGPLQALARQVGAPRRSGPTPCSASSCFPIPPVPLATAPLPAPPPHTSLHTALRPRSLFLLVNYSGLQLGHGHDWAWCHS